MKTKKKQSRTGIVIVAIALLAVAVALGIQRSPTSTGAQSPAVPKQTPFDGDRAFEDLKKMVTFGPRPAGSDALEKTRAYITSELEKVGLKPILDNFEGRTPRGNIKMVNIRAVRPGAKATTIALTGHYDTKRFSDFRFDGASDGGSSA